MVKMSVSSIRARALNDTNGGGNGSSATMTTIATINIKKEFDAAVTFAALSSHIENIEFESRCRR